jgi:hypothetical protein
MKETAKRVSQELHTLIKQGEDLLKASVLADRLAFMDEYHEWYARSLIVVSSLLPDRLADFERLYRVDKRKDINRSTFAIEDYLQGLDLREGLESIAVEITAHKVANQLSILRSASARLGDTLSSIEGILQADLFDSEIEASRELKKTGHLRAAGAVAGVVLESHLAKVCQNHGTTVRKKNPTVSDFNDFLKNSDVLDIPTWRWIQRLADLRNLCVHSKERDPTPDEIQELIDGADKAIKTIV